MGSTLETTEGASRFSPDIKESALEGLLVVRKKLVNRKEAKGILTYENFQKEIRDIKEFFPELSIEIPQELSGSNYIELIKETEKAIELHDIITREDLQIIVDKQWIKLAENKQNMMSKLINPNQRKGRTT